jgi:uncharacterized membrane protein YfcA
MDFLGTPDIGPLLFFGFCVASMVTAFVGVFTGTAGGVILLALMALVMPPSVLIPVHTVVQLGSGITRAVIMWRYVMKHVVPSFAIGVALGAFAGAKTFVALSPATLQFIIGAFILFITWMPKLGRIGGEKRRFALLGFLATFLGVFVSATGTLIAPFIAAASPDRRNHVATQGALMTFVHIAKLVAFGFLGFSIWAYLPLMIAMVVTGAIGNWVGEMALARTTEQRFRSILKIFLTALALELLWRSAREAGLF